VTSLSPPGADYNKIKSFPLWGVRFTGKTVVMKKKLYENSRNRLSILPQSLVGVLGDTRQ